MADAEREQDKVISCWKKIGSAGDSSCPRLVPYSHCRNCPVYITAARRLFDRQLPGRYAEEWAEIFAPPKDVSPLANLSVILFRIHGRWLAMRMNYFVEIAPLSFICPVPFRTNRLFRGLVNIHGELLLCVSLQEGLDLGTAEETPGGRMLVLQKDNERYAGLVEEVGGIERLQSNSVGQVPANGGTKNLFSGIVTIGERVVWLIDEEQLFATLRARMFNSLAAVKKGVV